MRLKGEWPWMQELQVLEDTDMRALNERAMTQEEKNDEEWLQQLGMMNEIVEGGVASPGIVVMGGIVMGEGRRTLAWIWYNSGIAAEGARQDEAIVEVLHAEWCKEELVLLDEEMRRTIEYGKWQSTWWKERRDEAADGEVGEGKKGYAAERMETELVWSTALESKWSGIRNEVQLVIIGLDTGELIKVELMQEDMIDGEEDEGGEDEDEED
ncbi:hypothetical protein C8J57DRAFT_1521237 [Mycena rebaudengoi]|nr:hypothetical protein C8J57DRAFT_1521237 [Mycena rebaudengoi]